MDVYDSSHISLVGGTATGNMNAWDSSIIGIAISMGGTVTQPIYTYDSSLLEIYYGTVTSQLIAANSSRIEIGGGDVVGAELIASGSSVFTLIGNHFMVDGMPVPYGDLTLLTGTLTGTLAYGGSVNSTFYQGGWAGWATGTIRLVSDTTSLMINNGLAPPNTANVIDYEIPEDGAYVRNVGCPPGWPAGDPDDPCPSPGDPTEVSLVDGGSVGSLNAFDSSSITMSGGHSSQGLVANDSSTVTMSGGWVPGLSANDNATVINTGGGMYQLIARGSATVTMSGGYANMDGLYAYDNANVTISGGGFEAIWAGDSSTLTMTDGSSLYGIVAYGNSVVTITGGTIKRGVSANGHSTVTISGGVVGEPSEHLWGMIWASESSLLTVVGNDFAVDGVPVPYGNLTALGQFLTGTLASGEPLEVRFSGNITLSPPTECSDFVDNDGDGRTDFDPVTFANPGNVTTPPSGTGDVGCGSPTWHTESPECQDGINNDFNTGIDFDGALSVWGVAVDQPDPQCIAPWWTSEAPWPRYCGLGVELALLLPPLMWLYRRRWRPI